jgi:DNA-binding transcriptional MerR regulator
LQKSNDHGGAARMNIKTISKLTGLSAHTLRYDEKIGIILTIGRDAKGHRDYSEKDRTLQKWR